MRRKNVPMNELVPAWVEEHVEKNKKKSSSTCVIIPGSAGDKKKDEPPFEPNTPDKNGNVLPLPPPPGIKKLFNLDEERVALCMVGKKHLGPFMEGVSKTKFFARIKSANGSKDSDNLLVILYRSKEALEHFEPSDGANAFKYTDAAEEVRKALAQSESEGGEGDV